MLKLKPSCEHCDKPLPPESTDARICSYECTFCAGCVERVLNNICSNCGGGFERRPVRPKKEWVTGVSLKQQPATTEKTFKPVDFDQHMEFAEGIDSIPPYKR